MDYVDIMWKLGLSKVFFEPDASYFDFNEVMSVA